MKMNTKAIRIMTFGLALSAGLSVNALAATIGGGTVDASALNLRAEASTAANAKLVLPEGAFLLVEESTNGWYKAVYNGVEGYVSSEFVKFSQTAEGSFNYKVTVIGESVRMRSGPSTSDYVIGSFNNGDSFTVLGVNGAWLKVSTPGGSVGYIRSDFLNLGSSGATTAAVAAAATSAASVSTAGSNVVASAKEYLGTRYVWAGMSTSGFDCSGFVNYVYKLYGYSMNRVAQDIFSNDGTAVAKENLQPGDLVFFGYSTTSISHVGMYIGDGQFIHASSSAGKVVITNLSDNWYTRMYMGAKRILQ